MDFQTPEHWDSIRAGVREVCGRYGGEYWRRLDRERGFPEEFVAELSREGWLSTMIPTSSTAAAAWGSPRRASCWRR